MEYLGRSYRYLDHVGDYDLMALAYGYTGVRPTHMDWYCTDEDLADLNDSSKSAECSKDDATADPFGFFQARLVRAIDLLVARGRDSSPVWTFDNDMKTQLSIALTGMGVYAESAEKTGSQWTSFFNELGRPQQVSEVKAYVRDQLKAALCDSSLEKEVERKDSSEGKEKVVANLTYLRTTASKVLSPVFKAEELACATQ
jgi:hypothetical protein